MKLGKLPARDDVRTIRLGALLGAGTPTSPAAVAPPAVADSGMYANDRMADCTCSAAAHLIKARHALERTT
ncbi:MAG: hypothetical protein JWR37_2533, partial [Mycobacterium sp.]|nr:hypothetical protein [Mycobacterium sp.]